MRPRVRIVIALTLAALALRLYWIHYLYSYSLNPDGLTVDGCLGVANGPTFVFRPHEDRSQCPIRDALVAAGVLQDLCGYGGPGGCWSQQTCARKSCLNRLPLPCSLPSPPSLNAVLTMAIGPDYGPEWVTVFCGSLRRAGFAGLIVVVMGEHPSDPLTHALLSALDVEVYVIDVSAYPTSRLTAIRFLAYEEYLIANRDRLAKSRILTIDARDVYFQGDPFDFEWVGTSTGYPTFSEGSSTTARMAPTLGRAMPQWNAPTQADLIFVVESVGHDHSTSAVNLGYVASCVPKTEASWLSSNRMAITNSGTIFGSYAGQRLYLQEMKSWYSDTRVLDLVSVGANGTEARYTHTPNSDDCIDQGLQNYLVFTGAFDRLFFDKRTDPRAGIAGGVGYLFDETGPIRTLALGTAWLCAGPPDTSHGIRSGEPEVTDASGKKAIKNGRVVNMLGVPARIVHQFDRRCGVTLRNDWLLGSADAVESALARFAKSYPSRLKMLVDSHVSVIQCPD